MNPDPGLTLEQVAALRAEFATDNGTPGPDARINGPTGAADALDAARVDLVELIRGGIPEREYVPGAPFLIAGKRYLFPAPAGDGKSLAGLVIAVDVVEAGGTVVILDVENGDDEYARRLADVLAARDDADGALAHACSERLRYHAWPALSMNWGADEWAAAVAPANLAIFDSSRLVLSAAGLAEDKSDDYATFVNALLIPLSRAGITTLVLDNTGHEEHDRARGTKAKDDLNEVRYTVKVGQPFDRDRHGHVRLVRGRTRFADLPGELHVPLGDGTYGPVREAEPAADSVGFRPTHLMERASKIVGDNPGLSRNKVLALVGGKKDYAAMALACLIGDGYVRVEHGPRGAHHHHSDKPYREATDPHRDPGSPPGPDQVPDPVVAQGPRDRPEGPTRPGPSPDPQPPEPTLADQLLEQLGRDRQEGDPVRPPATERRAGQKGGGSRGC